MIGYPVCILLFFCILPASSYLNMPLKEVALEQDEEVTVFISLPHHYQIIHTKISLVYAAFCTVLKAGHVVRGKDTIYGKSLIDLTRMQKVMEYQWLCTAGADRQHMALFLAQLP